LKEWRVKYVPTMEIVLVKTVSKFSPIVCVAFLLSLTLLAKASASDHMLGDSGLVKRVASSGIHPVASQAEANI
jgi:hypothetical protein